MRITNGIINNNQLYNINNNKVYIDELNNQMSTQKKINNPSDDPIVAIRSLRLRSSLSEITQYYTKNVPDALSWVDTTGTALDTTKEILRKLKSEYTSAANDTNTVSDRQIILTELKSLATQFYTTGNATNEDRYLFTGYRTGDSLTFTKEDLEERQNLNDEGKFKYQNITENFGIDNVEQYSFVTGAISNSDIVKYKEQDVNETRVVDNSVYRLRLAYNNIDADSSGRTAALNFTYTDADGNLQKEALSGVTLVELPISGGADDETELSEADIAELNAGTKIFFNKNTGNVIFGDPIREEISKKNAMTPPRSLTVTYDKSTWNVGDLKPEHYFHCDEVGGGKNGESKTIEYRDYHQEIQFTVATGQQVTINTNASDVFLHSVGRDIEELELAIEGVNVAQSKVDRLKSMREDKVTYGVEGSEEQEKIRLLLSAAEKELDYATQKMATLFSNGVTKATDYYDKANFAGTATGTTESRLNIIKNRLSENQTTVKTQASDNENVEISDVMVEVSAAQLAYNAALIATGKISQQSLVNYI
ncbi:MAG: hypothetical protein IJU93_01050 [Lachnospiraceae bacterium]|nr:hypothetical protein [Lachnospiraceae bacterium]